MPITDKKKFGQKTQPEDQPTPKKYVPGKNFLPFVTDNNPWDLYSSIVNRSYGVPYKLQMIALYHCIESGIEKVREKLNTSGVDTRKGEVYTRIVEIFGDPLAGLPLAWLVDNYYKDEYNQKDMDEIEAVLREEGSIHLFQQLGMPNLFRYLTVLNLTMWEKSPESREAFLYCETTSQIERFAVELGNNLFEEDPDNTMIKEVVAEDAEIVRTVTKTSDINRLLWMYKLFRCYDSEYFNKKIKFEFIAEHPNASS